MAVSPSGSPTAGIWSFSSSTPRPTTSVPRGVHFQDLLALQPTREELEAAASWVRSQDPTPEFATALEKVVQHAQHHAR
ncbi:MAG: hypothetical protein HY700_11680 [Gemmatimonadetes bacterium]|nr:hypothetical protein [Gemmatimonadota bacterium]